MIIGVPRETRADECRVAATPDSTKRLIKLGFKVQVERGAGTLAGYLDSEFEAAGATLCDTNSAWKSDIVLHVTRPQDSEIKLMKPQSLLIGLLEPFLSDSFFETLAQAKIDSIALEWIPRTSRAQSMDVLSSQANIAGYRAVLEAFTHYPRFAPLMMTSAGSAKAAKIVILGVGVAGLQAIATAKRMGATVEAYDVRPETKEQILSLGAKPIEINLGEEGSGQGGYAKELSDEGKKKLQAALDERLSKVDIIITTANVPGRKAPTLVSSDVVKKMRPGSVIVDMAAPSGGNCPLTQAGKTIDANGVKIVGITNYPSLMPYDASSFFARNLVSLLDLLKVKIDIADDIIDASLMTHQGVFRKKRN